MSSAFLTAILAGLVIVAPRSGAGEPSMVEGVAAQVGDEVVLSSEVEEQLAFLRMRANLPDTSIARAREEILQSLIDEKIVVQEARARGITVTDVEVEQAVSQHLDSVKQQMGGDEVFQQELKKEGLTEEDLRARYREDARREILTSRLMQREVYSKIEIPETELKAYYEEHRSELPKKPGKLTLAHIFIALKANEEAIARAQAKLDRIEGRLTAGEDFATIAREESDDAASRQNAGDLGWFAPGDIDPRIAAEVQKLAPGDISPPFQVPQGVEIIRLIEREGERAHLAHIRVAIELSEADRQRARTEAEKVHKLAKDGADFAALAREHSDDLESAEKGGSLGDFDEAELNPVIAAAVRGLAAGQISEGVSSDAGYHIFKVLKREGGGEYSYEEVQERLRMRMLEERAVVLTEEWLAGVRKNYFVRRTEHAPSAPGPSGPQMGVRAVVAGGVDSAGARTPETEEAP